MDEAAGIHHNLVDYFLDVFGGFVNKDTIENVVVNCNYDSEASTSAILQLIENSTILEQNKRKVSNNNTTSTEFEYKKHRICSTDVFAKTDSNIIASSEKKSQPNDRHRTMSKKELQVERVIDSVKRGNKTLIILRGLPGSGKTFLGRRIIDKCCQHNMYEKHIFSADDYFMNSKSQYVYDRMKLSEAHNWTKGKVREALSQGINPIIVDNTNCQIWEMKPYAILAVASSYKIEVLEPFTHWSFNIKELTQRNIHSVPKQKISEMCDRFDKTVTTEKIYFALDMPYKDLEVEKVSNVDLKELQAQTSSKTYDEKFEKLSLENICNTLKLGTGDLNDTEDKADFKQDTLQKKCMDVSSKPFDADLSKWGVSGKSLQSWELVIPVENTEIEHPTFNQFHEFKPYKTEDKCTFIETHLLNSDLIDKDIKTIVPKGYFCCSDTQNFSKPSSKYTLDKSSMTDEFLINDVQEDAKLRELINLFPDVPPDILSDFLEKCNYDIDWTAELLLEDKREIFNISSMEQNVDVASDVDNVNSKLEHPSSSESKLESDQSSTIHPTNLPSTSQLDVLRNEQLLEHELVELTFNPSAISTLEAKFGDPTLIYPSGLLPVIQIPASLAKQLYVFYLESVFQQMEVQKQVLDRLLKEDEELAKKFQEEELAAVQRIDSSAHNLQNIMRDEINMNRKMKENERYNPSTPDNLAKKLTVQKLISTFPFINKTKIIELLNLHNNNYEETIKSIMVSYRIPEIAEADKKPPIPQDTFQELEEDYTLCMKDMEPECSAVDYRNEAEECLRVRNDYRNKAQRYYQQGLPEVAHFYSNLAKEQTKKCEVANNFAVHAFLLEQKKLIRNTETLDLHYLKMKEALASLDIFIDTEIAKLKNLRFGVKHFFIITGRGKRSENGISVIRPAVVKRLSDRNIKFTFMNPGLIKITLTSNTALSTQC